MNALKIADALNHVDDDLLTEALEAVPQKSIKTLRRWCVLAACLVLLVGTITVAATTELGSQLLQTFTGETQPDSDMIESGYTLSIPIKRISLSSLTGEIREVPSIILKQIENYQPWSSQMPNHYLRRFPSPESAWQFIGLEKLYIPQWDLEVQYTSLSALGDENSGDLLTFTLEIFHRTGDINVQFRSTVYTELWDSDTVYHTSIANQELTYTESFYTTGNGLTCHIISTSTMESGYQGLHGFLVHDGILYELNVSYLAEDSAKAEEIFYQWADQFGG